MKIIIHYKSGLYLSLTGNWIYSQISSLKKYQPIVYAFRVENLDVYPTDKIRSLVSKNKLMRPIGFFNKVFNKLFGYSPIFYYFLKKDKPDLVHAHFGPSGYDFLKYKKFFRFPLITTFYGYDLSMLPLQHPEWIKKYKKLFQEGEKFLAEGNYMKKRLIELGCPEKKITIQHLGIDLNKIKFVPREIGEDNEIKILIAASFREKKGIPYALKAIGKAITEYKDVDLKITIIGDSNGTDNSEKEKKKIYNIITEYNLKNRVNMLGYQSHNIFLNELYKNHIFLHPSIHASDGDTEGGAPVSIIEASASGMPVLSTLHCDIPEIIIDKKSGFLVPERDIDSLKEKLRYLILNNNLWEEMGLAGRKHIEEEYSIKKQAIKLETIYDNCIM